MADGVNYIQRCINAALAGAADLVFIEPAADALSQRMSTHAVHIVDRRFFSAIGLPKQPRHRQHRWRESD